MKRSEETENPKIGSGVAGSSGAETRQNLRKLRAWIHCHRLFRAQDLLCEVQARADCAQGQENSTWPVRKCADKKLSDLRTRVIPAWITHRAPGNSGGCKQVKRASAVATRKDEKKEPQLARLDLGWVTELSSGRSTRGARFFCMQKNQKNIVIQFDIHD